MDGPGHGLVAHCHGRHAPGLLRGAAADGIVLLGVMSIDDGVASPVRAPVGACGRRLTSVWSQWVIGYGLSSVAQGMPLVVVVAAMHDAGQSALWVTIAAAARLVPYVVCSPVAGVLAGRHRFGVVCRTASVFRLAVLFVLTVLIATRPQPVLLAATLFVLTAAGTPVYPGLMAATRAVMPVERLAAANAVTAAVESAAFIAGPALAGLLLATSGHSVVMVAACGLMAVAAVLAGPPADPTTPRLTAADRHRLSVDISAAAGRSRLALLVRPWRPCWPSTRWRAWKRSCW